MNRLRMNLPAILALLNRRNQKVVIVTHDDPFLHDPMLELPRLKISPPPPFVPVAPPAKNTSQEEARRARQRVRREQKGKA